MTVLSGNLVFGAGRFWGINNVSNPTPARFGKPQDMSIDFKRGIQKLYSESTFASAIALGQTDVTGKVTMGQLSPRILSDLLFGAAGAAGQILEADKEAGTVPGSSSYEVTVTQDATWTTDLGVQYADGSGSFVRVASAPTVGQYSVAAGVYTFAAADANKNVQISYLYTQASSGEKMTIPNTLQGPIGSFTGVMMFPWGTGEQNVITLNNCLVSDSGIASKGGDFAKPTFGFEASVDAADNLGTFSFAQAA